MASVRRSKTFILVAGILITLLLFLTVPSGKASALRAQGLERMEAPLGKPAKPDNAVPERPDSPKDNSADGAAEHAGVPDLADAKSPSHPKNDNEKPIAAKVKEAGEKVKEAGEKVGEKSKETGEKAKEIGEKVGEKAKEAGEKAKEAGEKAKEAGEKAKEVGGKVGEKAKELNNVLNDKVSDKVKEETAAVKDPFKKEKADKEASAAIKAAVGGDKKEDSSAEKEGSAAADGAIVDGVPVAETVKKAAPKVAAKDTAYVVMIDAGSTGSRVHVYSFDTSQKPPVLLDEAFKMLKPGLSSFDTDTLGAAASLDPLLDLAKETIPKDKWGCSPVALKATAGLRLLGEEKSGAILKEVRKHLETDYPFPVVEGDGVSIMDGSDEGVYAWITTNYLLGNIGSTEKTPTAAVFDLGGGSTQIVFEPIDGEKMLAGEHKYEIDFGGRHFTLYQYSHLGYGLMEGRQKVNGHILSLLQKKGALPSTLVPLTDAEIKDIKNVKSQGVIKNPCVPPGVTAENVKVTAEDGSVYVVDFVSPAKDIDDPIAASASTQCRFLSEAILNKQEVCDTKECSFNGIYQPSLKRQFPRDSDMFVFSYFYDRLEPIGMPLDFTLGEMSDITQLVCSGSELWSQFFLQDQTIKDLVDEPLWCLDLSYMTALLHTGYDIRLARELRTAKTIQGKELGWCLGASLPLLDANSGWTCKVAKDISKE